MSPLNNLFILTGSIALYKVLSVISHFKKENQPLKIVATPAALKFIGLSTLEGLIADKIHTDLYEAGANMDHIHLVRWANRIIIAPASANFLNKISQGIGDDLASTLMLAHDFTKPVLIFPAMNSKMYAHPATQKSINTLKDWGYQVFDSATGILACGEVGPGRLLEPEEIIQKINQSLSEKNHAEKSSSPVMTTQKAKAPRILISAGGTQEPIDDVRVISNKSTGKTAAYLADQLIEQGFDVTYLAAQNATKPLLDCPVVSFTTFNDLQNQLNQLLTEDFSVFIHAAAVSDYSVESRPGKMDSQKEEIQLILKRNPKLINQVKKINPQIKLIGFKLTASADENDQKQKIKTLFNDAACDLVVHNDWTSIKNNQHTFQLVQPSMSKTRNLQLSDLANELVQYSITVVKS